MRREMPGSGTEVLDFIVIIRNSGLNQPYVAVFYCPNILLSYSFQTECCPGSNISVNQFVLDSSCEVLLTNHETRQSNLT